MHTLQAFHVNQQTLKQPVGSEWLKEMGTLNRISGIVKN